MAKQWFVRRGDKVFGPFHSAKLKALATNGQVTQSTQVGLQESGPWVNADKVRGLFTTTAPAEPPPASGSVPPNPMPDAEQTPVKATPADPEPAEQSAKIPTSTAISPLQKTFPIAVLTRSGGKMSVSVGAAGSLWHGDRWSFSITARTDKKGEVKATIEYGPDTDSAKQIRARKTIADFSQEQVERLACDMVDAKIEQAGSTVWKTRISSVNYAAIISVNYGGVLRQGQAYVVSLQTRKMRLDSRTLAPEPCTAEITRGRKLWETTANGLGIDDAYNALDRVLNELLCGDDDKEDEDDY
jgi:hypothetical protein